MNELHSNIDRIFKERFDDYHNSPPEEVWTEIKKELDKSGKKRTPVVITNLAATLVILILSGVSIYYFNQYYSGNLKGNNLINNKLSVSELNIIKNDFADIINNSTINKTNKVSDNKTVIYSNNNKTNNNSNYNNIPDKNTNTTKQNSENILSNANDAVNLPDVTNNNEEIILSDAEFTAETEDPVNIETTLPNVNDNNDIEISSNMNEVAPIHDYGKHSALALGINFYPEYTQNPTSIEYGGELTLRYEIKNWILATGIGLQTGNANNEYEVTYKKYEVSDQYTYVTGFTIDSIPIMFEDRIIGYAFKPVFETEEVDIYDSISHISVLEKSNSFYRLNIPFAIGYKWQIKKSELFVKGGGIYSYLYKNTEAEITVTDEDATLTSIQFINARRSRHQYDLFGSVGYGFYMTHNISLNVEPYFRYSLKYFDDENLALSGNPYSYGLKAGISLHF